MPRLEKSANGRIGLKQKRQREALRREIDAEIKKQLCERAIADAVKDVLTRGADGQLYIRRSKAPRCDAVEEWSRGWANPSRGIK